MQMQKKTKKKKQTNKNMVYCKAFYITSFPLELVLVSYFIEALLSKKGCQRWEFSKNIKERLVIKRGGL